MQQIFCIFRTKKLHWFVCTLLKIHQTLSSTFFQGQKFASAEQKIVLAKLLRKYRIFNDLHELENRGLPELIL